MALLFNPIGGDSPDDEEDDGFDVHDPSCRCDICEEERAMYGTDDDYDQNDDDDREQPI